MTPVPKKKKTRSGTKIRRGAKALGKSEIFRLYSKAKGREKKNR